MLDRSMKSWSSEIGRDNSSSRSSLPVHGASRQLPPANASSSYHYSEHCSDPLSGEISPCNMSPWHHSNGVNGSYADSSNSWSQSSIPSAVPPQSCLIDSLIREEGHIYSLAVSGPLLYTGSDSKNIRVWNDQKEFAAFKSSSGLVKAIIIASRDRILTGHQDGKIRVWRISPKDPTIYKRAGSLPRLTDLIKCSLKPSNYAGHRSALWIRHSDAVSCLSISVEEGLLYSGSWDRTFKVWRMSDAKCLESLLAHNDAVNSVVAAKFEALVFTGSADGTVKMWRRDLKGKGCSKHRLIQTLLRQDSAVTGLVICPTAPVLYASSSDGLINFWEWERERKMFVHGGALRGHKLAVLCVAATGRLVLSGSADKSICVWRRDGAGVHSCLSVLTGHSGPVKCLAIQEEDHSSQGTVLLYSGSLDKSVKVWRVSEQPPPHYSFPLDPN